MADPCIVSWPARLGAAAGGVRHQFAHAVDVLPSVLELAGVDAPSSIDGVDAVALSTGAASLPCSARRGRGLPATHTTQYFEMFGSRAIYHDGWKAVTFHPVGPVYDDGRNPNASFDDDVWELYHVAEDLSESDDLAAAEPERLSAMIALWWDEAARNDVLPLDNRPLWALINKPPDRRRERAVFRYFQGGAPVPESVAVPVQNRSHAVRVGHRGRRGRRPARRAPRRRFRVGRLVAPHSRWLPPLRAQPLRQDPSCAPAAPAAIGAGAHQVAFEFTKDEGLGGPVQLRVDGLLVAAGVINRFTPAAFNGLGVGLTCGYEWGPAVGEEYVAPFTFNGRILRAEVEVTGPVVRNPLAEIAAILAEQ